MKTVLYNDVENVLGINYQLSTRFKSKWSRGQEGHLVKNEKYALRRFLFLETEEIRYKETILSM